MGCAIIGLGVGAMLLPGKMALAGLLLVGLGCAPIYPCIIHSTPANFGPEKSQALIGVQMASAYVGTLTLPPLFGLIANHIGAWVMPVYLLTILVLMVWMHEKMMKKVAHRRKNTPCRSRGYFCDQKSPTSSNSMTWMPLASRTAQMW
jgi:fucose permease